MILINCAEAAFSEGSDTKRYYDRGTISRLAGALRLFILKY